MSYETRKEEASRDQRYENLENRTQRLVDQVGTWVADATNLHTDSPLAQEKTDVIAMRDQFVLDLKAQLGI